MNLSTASGQNISSPRLPHTKSNWQKPEIVFLGMSCAEHETYPKIPWVLEPGLGITP